MKGRVAAAVGTLAGVGEDGAPHPELGEEGAVVRSGMGVAHLRVGQPTCVRTKGRKRALGSKHFPNNNITSSRPSTDCTNERARDRRVRCMSVYLQFDTHGTGTAKCRPIERCSAHTYIRWIRGHVRAHICPCMHGSSLSSRLAHVHGVGRRAGGVSPQIIRRRLLHPTAGSKYPAQLKKKSHLLWHYAATRQLPR